jgi:dolichol kinase
VSRRELVRRLVHTCLGAGAYLLAFISWEWAAALFAAAVLVNALLLPRLPGMKFLMRADGSGHAGLILYPLVLLLLTLAFRDRVAVVQAAWLAMAVGDGLAPLFGEFLERPAWPWCRSKSVPASVIAFGLAFTAMLPVLSPAVAAAAAGAGLLGESLPPPSNDNLVVPVLAAAAVLAAGG